MVLIEPFPFGEDSLVEVTDAPTSTKVNNRQSPKSLVFKTFDNECSDLISLAVRQNIF
jgi:hypothetical protein